MKKTIFVSMIIMTQLMTCLYAGGDRDIELHQPEHIELEHEESKFYLVVAALMDLGDSVNHESAVLTGDRDYGFGIDIGYRIGNGFAVEYDFTYARNTVTKIEGSVVEEALGIYYTSALDLVYVYEVGYGVGFFGKIGYEYEWETISDYHIDTEKGGVIFGGGIEIEMTEHYKFLVEYEDSRVESTRGASVLVGLMYNF